MYKLFVSAILVSIIACNTQEPENKILKAKTFENVLYDVHVADAMLKHKNKSDRKIQEINKSFYNHIFLKYEISRADFEANVRTYSQNPIEMQHMYDRIINRLTNEKNAFQKVDTAQKSIAPKELKPPS